MNLWGGEMSTACIKMNGEYKTVDIMHGSVTHDVYYHVSLEETLGRRVQAVAAIKVDSSYGYEPCTIMLFEDGTYHGFVHPFYD